MVWRKNVTDFTDNYFNVNNSITSMQVTGSRPAAAVIMVEAATAMELISV